MSDVAITLPAAPARKPVMRTATAIVWLLALVGFMVIAWYVIHAGFVRRGQEGIVALALEWVGGQHALMTHILCIKRMPIDRDTSYK